MRLQMEPLVLTEANFEAEVERYDGLAVIDFWAPWCGPCRMFSPIVDEIAADPPAGVKVCKVNVDECQDIAMRFGVSSIPTVLVFKNGELVDRAVGARPKKAFEQMLDQQLQD